MAQHISQILILGGAAGEGGFDGAAGKGCVCGGGGDGDDGGERRWMIAKYSTCV